MNRLPASPILLLLALVAPMAGLGAGCGASAQRAQGTTPDARDEARLAELEEARRRQDEEIRALRSELAIARAEAESLRDAQASSRVASISIRSGAEAADPGASASAFSGTHEADPSAAWIEPDAGEVVVAEPSAPTAGPRPVLRVRGVPNADTTTVVPTPTLPPGAHPPGFAPSPSGAATASAPTPTVPSSGAMPPSFAGSSGALGTAPLPDPSLSGVALTPVAPEPRAQAPDTAVIAYRAALAKLRDREYGQALEAFDSFLSTHPGHPYAANAQYWRAEAIYAQRRYRDALRAFEVFVQRHGAHPKVADALLKMGLCHARSGDTGRARVLFQRVQQEYPDTVAARIASREEAS